MGAAEWIALVALVLGPVSLLLVFLYRLGSKVSTLAANVSLLLEAVRDDREAHIRIWQRVDEHGERITRLEAVKERHEP